MLLDMVPNHAPHLWTPPSTFPPRPSLSLSLSLTHIRNTPVLSHTLSQALLYVLCAASGEQLSLQYTHAHFLPHSHTLSQALLDVRRAASGEQLSLRQSLAEAEHAAEVAAGRATGLGQRVEHLEEALREARK
jgi:hypothetical protein